jgi:putative exosortase-associated protein (TIGR04073 family)
MRRRIFLVAVTAVIFLHAGTALAGNPLTKLGRGLTNIVFSFMEFPTNIQKAADRKGTASGFFEGVAAGTYYMVGRTLAGVYDVVTFLIPLPAGYKAVMKPDYVFGAAAEA